MSLMKIISLESVGSTHTYLKEYIKSNSYCEPLCVFTQNQTDGIGSRGNSWVGVKGNLFFSFVVDKSLLPSDLPIQSASIYFSYLLKDVLHSMGSKLWLKWPNDFYINDAKIGGTITTATSKLLYCGIGLNLITVSDEYEKLDIEVDINNLLQDYFKKINKAISWQEILKEYVIEFHKSKKFSATLNNQKVSLEEAELNDDGSININNEKVFSLR